MATNKKKSKKPAKKMAKPVKKATKPIKASAKPAKKASKPTKKTAKPATKPQVTGRLTITRWAELITPLDDRLVVQVEKYDKTPGGLFIPATNSDRPQQGKVLAVGRGRRDKKGRVRPMDVKAGDEIYFAPFSGTELQVLNQEVLILREADVLGIIE